MGEQRKLNWVQKAGIVGTLGAASLLPGCQKKPDPTSPASVSASVSLDNMDPAIQQKFDPIKDLIIDFARRYDNREHTSFPKDEVRNALQNISVEVNKSPEVQPFLDFYVDNVLHYTLAYIDQKKTIQYVENTSQEGSKEDQEERLRRVRERMRNNPETIDLLQGAIHNQQFLEPESLKQQKSGQGR